MTAFGGPLAGHMALHILLMNLVAPLAALALNARQHPGPPNPLPYATATVTTAQIVLLWGWHSPGLLERTLHAPFLHPAMMLSLFLVALWFWTTVFQAHRTGTWRALLALLVTGKVFCLLGVLLVFAPRPLYPALADIHGAASLPQGALRDQQLAGLLMLTACPLTYVAAGVVLAARWIRILDVGTGPAPARRAAASQRAT